MNQNDLMAPPSPEELASAKQQGPAIMTLMAPPTQDELASTQPKTSGSILDRLADAKKQFEASKVEDPTTPSKLKDAAKVYADSFLLNSTPILSGAQNVAQELGSEGINKLKQLFGSKDIQKTPLQANQNLVAQGAQGDVGPTTLAQLYRQGVTDQQKNMDAAKENIGTAGTIGASLAGALTPMGPLSLATGAAHSLLGLEKTGLAAAKASGGLTGVGQELAKRAAVDAATMAPIGALQAGSESSGGLIGTDNDQKKQELNDIVHGAGTSGLVGAALNALPLAGAAKDKLAGLTEEQIAKSPMLANIAKSFQWGSQGTAPEDMLKSIPVDAAQDLVRTINKGKSAIGDQMGQSLQNATDLGLHVNIEPQLADAGQNIIQQVNQNPALGDQYTKNLSKIFQPGRTVVTPMEAQTTKADMRKILNSLGPATDPVSNQTRGIIQDFLGGVDGALKKQVPGFEDASDRYAQFMSSVPRNITRGDVPEDMLKSRFKPVKDQDLFTKTQNTINGTTATQNTTDNLEQGLGSIQDQEAQMIKDGRMSPDQSVFNQLGSPDSFLGKIKSAQNDVGLAKTLQDGVNLPISTKGISLGGLIPNADTANKLSYGAGKVSKVASAAAEAVSKPVNKIVDLGRGLYNASSDQLSGVVSRLRETDPSSAIAESLEKAIQNGDSVAKNAAIFSIMQQPAQRAKLGGDNGSGSDSN